MAKLSDMHLGYLENLLVQNPGNVQIFTGVFFTDIPANSGGFTSGQAYGNPSRSQVQSAFQAKADKAKYLAGAQIPVSYADPSTNSLSGQLSTVPDVSNGASSAQSGLPNQTPTNAIAVTQASIAPIAQISASSDDNVQEGVLQKPPAYVQRIQKTADVINSN